MSWSRPAARDLAIEALGFIAADPDLVTALVGGAGMRPDDLRRLGEDDDLCLAVLDFILEEDRRVLDFARGAGLRPEAVMQARTVLAGPGSAGWSAD